MAETRTAHPRGGKDALDTLAEQDKIIAGLLDDWSARTRQLTDHDDVDVRWRRGSAVKLLLQHLAVREEAKQQIVARLDEVGQGDLARRLEGDGPARRSEIDDLEAVTRGHQAITLNTPEADIAVERVLNRARAEIGEDGGGLLDAVAGALGPAGERGLPGDRAVRMHSVTRPSPHPRWYDRVGPLKAARAWYDHLRGTPHGMVSPDVDAAREHQPGPRP